jgi:hypothetical protein
MRFTQTATASRRTASSIAFGTWWLAEGQLDRVGRGFDQDVDDVRHALDAVDEAGLAEEAMVDGHVERTPGERIEQPVQTVGRHCDSSFKTCPGLSRESRYVTE